MDKGYVEFPNLFRNHGLRIPIREVAFTVFGFEVRWYGVLISGAVVLCILLALRACRHYGIEPDDLLDYLIFSIPAAIIGARAYYVISNFDAYRDDLSSIFHYWEGGLAVYGGVIAALLTAFIVAKVKKQPLLRVIDFAMPYILLGQAIGRWGNFVNQEAYGRATTLPWGMTGNQIAEEVVAVHGWPAGTLVHPTFLYESLWCFLGFFLLLLYRRRFRRTEGECFALYMIYYGCERVVVEGLRMDSLYIGHTGVRTSQLLSGILIVVGIALLIDLRRRWTRRVYETGETEATHGGAEAEALPVEAQSGLETVVERMDQGDGEAGGAPGEGR